MLKLLASRILVGFLVRCTLGTAEALSSELHAYSIITITIPVPVSIAIAIAIAITITITIISSSIIIMVVVEQSSLGSGISGNPRPRNAAG